MKENIDNHICTPLKNLEGEKQHISHTQRDTLQLTTYKHVLVCVNTKATAGKGVKENKRQHASLR